MLVNWRISKKSIAHDMFSITCSKMQVKWQYRVKDSFTYIYYVDIHIPLEAEMQNEELEERQRSKKTRCVNQKYLFVNIKRRKSESYQSDKNHIENSMTKCTLHTWNPCASLISHHTHRIAYRVSFTFNKLTFSLLNMATYISNASLAR